ncbi:MAG: (Fe-S)-binding protein [Gemmatimonadales bacterium]|nr:(Fe-S)-binding protein [Gemmatimonadales bacterium]
MKVALFVPCYVDQLYPQVARATLAVLEAHGVTVAFPMEQTCCGQPMANAGCESDARAAEERFVRTFAEYDAIVAPSGSCVHHVRHHFDQLPQTDAVRRVRARTHELCEFLLTLPDWEPPPFPFRVGVHVGCHALRGLRQGSPSELGPPRDGPMQQLLRRMPGIELVPLDRADECCGFGGSFAVDEAAISARMGSDRIADHRRHGAEVLVSADMSCLMHLEGIIRRQAAPLPVMHVAQLLNGERP